MLFRREGDAVRRAAALLAELHLHLQQHVSQGGEGGLHAGPDLQRLIVSEMATSGHINIIFRLHSVICYNDLYSAPQCIFSLLILYFYRCLFVFLWDMDTFDMSS